ncbi:hypothetical protein Tco_0302868 [Tanacetum coccineum]
MFSLYTWTDETSIDSVWLEINTIILVLKDSRCRKKERIKSIALKAKKESSDDETSTSGSDDEEYVMAVRNFKKFFRRKGKFVQQPREERKSFRQRDEKKGKSDRKCFRCGLGLDSDKASTSKTKTMSFVRSSAEKVPDRSTIKGHGSTLPGFVSRKDSEKGTKHVVSPPMSSRSDLVITRKKLINNSIDE